MGSTASSGSESGKGYYGEGDDEDDRPLPDQNTREKFHEVKEDVKDDVAEVTKGVKDDIQSATGDLEEDLGQLNVEVGQQFLLAQHCINCNKLQQMPEG